MNKNFMESVNEISDRRRKTRMKHLSEEFDKRAEYEKQISPNNTSIQAKIVAARKKLIQPGIAALTLAANVDVDFINKSVGGNATKRFNIYSVEKMADILHGMNSGRIRNAVNRSIIQSLFRFQTAGAPFTAIAAQGAVSQNLTVDKSIKDLLVRHTASPGTAPTQSSSTMNALQALGAVTNSGSAKHPIWQLTEEPVVDRIRELVEV